MLSKSDLFDTDKMGDYVISVDDYLKNFEFIDKLESDNMGDWAITSNAGVENDNNFELERYNENNFDDGWFEEEVETTLDAYSDYTKESVDFIDVEKDTFKYVLNYNGDNFQNTISNFEEVEIIKPKIINDG
jgi:hypothetical protein